MIQRLKFTDRPVQKQWLLFTNQGSSIKDVCTKGEGGKSKYGQQPTRGARFLSHFGRGGGGRISVQADVRIYITCRPRRQCYTTGVHIQSSKTTVYSPGNQCKHPMPRPLVLVIIIITIIINILKHEIAQQLFTLFNNMAK